MMQVVVTLIIVFGEGWGMHYKIWGSMLLKCITLSVKGLFVWSLKSNLIARTIFQKSKKSKHYFVRRENKLKRPVNL
jgi:hypothetical protein